jgi:hypothetical protein
MKLLLIVLLLLPLKLNASTSVLMDHLGGESGFGEHVLGVGDDFYQEIMLVPIFGVGIELNGTIYESIYINSNGSVHFEPYSIPLVEVDKSSPYFNVLSNDYLINENIYIDIISNRIIVTWKDVLVKDTNEYKTFQFVLQKIGNKFEVSYLYDSVPAINEENVFFDGSNLYNFNDQVVLFEFDQYGYIEYFSNTINNLVVDGVNILVEDEMNYLVEPTSNHVEVVIDTDGLIVSQNVFNVPGSYDISIKNSLGEIRTYRLLLEHKSITHSDFYEVNEDNVLSFNPLDNDDAGVVYISFDSPQNGKLSILDDWFYEPNENFFGTEVFNYYVKYQDNLYQELITIEVKPVNDSPVAGNDVFEINENMVIDFLKNDLDVDSDFWIEEISQGSSGGRIELDNGVYRYIPNKKQETEVFTYKITDGFKPIDSSLKNDQIGTIKIKYPKEVIKEIEIKPIKEIELIERIINVSEEDCATVEVVSVQSTDHKDEEIESTSDFAYSENNDNSFLRSLYSVLVGLVLLLLTVIKLFFG